TVHNPLVPPSSGWHGQVLLPVSISPSLHGHGYMPVPPESAPPAPVILAAPALIAAASRSLSAEALRLFHHLPALFGKPHDAGHEAFTGRLLLARVLRLFLGQLVRLPADQLAFHDRDD